MQKTPNTGLPSLPPGIRPPTKRTVISDAGAPEPRRSEGARLNRTRRRASTPVEWNVEEPEPGLPREVEAALHAKTRGLVAIVFLAMVALWMTFTFIASFTPFWPQAKEAVRLVEDVLLIVIGAIVGYYFCNYSRR